MKKYSILFLLLSLKSYTQKKDTIHIDNGFETTIITPSEPMDKPVNYIYRFNDKLDKEPTCVKGVEEYTKTLKKKIWIPPTDKQRPNQFSITYTFVIEKDGSLSNLDTNVVGYFGSPSETLKTEAEKAIKQMPKWIPGEVNGKPVRVRKGIKIDIKVK